MICRHFGVCGGCSLVTATYDEQLARKRARLAALLGIDVPPLLPSPRESAFRQKAAFAFGSGPGRRLIMGHYPVGSNRVVAVKECPVQSDRANRIAFAVRDRLVRANIAAADTRGGVLRHLLIRSTEDDSEAIAMLVVSQNDKSLRVPVRGLLASPDAPDGFYINVNTKPGPHMVGRETLKIAGRSHVRERGFGSKADDRVDFLVSPDAFFQTNVGAARLLVDLVLETTVDCQRVLDLYCGSGLFALPIARRGAEVTAVEESVTAIEDLKANVRLNRIPSARVTPLASRVEEALGRLASKPWDAVILDPPREGCAPGVLPAIFNRMRPPIVTYVSCNPDVLARDLSAIRSAGYRVDRIQPIDMFPHTDHIETVVTLTYRREDPEQSFRFRRS